MIRNLRDITGAAAFTVTNAGPVKLSTLLPAALQSLRGVLRVTIHNISGLRMELAWSSGAAPVTGSMDVLRPGDSLCLNWPSNRLANLYVNAPDGDALCYVWLEGTPATLTSITVLSVTGDTAGAATVLRYVFNRAVELVPGGATDNLEIKDSFGDWFSVVDSLVQVDANTIDVSLSSGFDVTEWRFLTLPQAIVGVTLPIGYPQSGTISFP